MSLRSEAGEKDASGFHGVVVDGSPILKYDKEHDDDSGHQALDRVSDNRLEQVCEAYYPVKRIEPAKAFCPVTSIRIPKTILPPRLRTCPGAT